MSFAGRPCAGPDDGLEERMYSTRNFGSIVLAAGLCLTATANAAELFDDFGYTGGGPGEPVDPQFECFGWYVRTGGGGPGPAGATWRADYVTWADDPLIAGNRVIRLRASTDGTAAGTFQSEVARMPTHSSAALTVPGSGTSIPLRKARSPACRPSACTRACLRSELLRVRHRIYASQPWGTRCGAQPALHFQTWEQYCDVPYTLNMIPSEPSPMCGSLAGWHTLTIIADSGIVRYYLDGLLRASHGGEYYPESTMRILLLHWFADQLGPGVSADMTIEVDWVYHARDAVLSPAQVQSAVDQFRFAGIVRRNTVEFFADCNGNAIPDYCEPDSDGDGIIDACEQIWRVKWDAIGAQTGLNWTDAFPTLQAALAVAQPGHEIWVAAGTYRPAPAGGDRNAAFDWSREPPSTAASPELKQNHRNATECQTAPCSAAISTATTARRSLTTPRTV